MYCKTAQNGNFACPAVDSNGHCTIFTDEGVAAKERHGICNYKEIRNPITNIEREKTRVGQQKQLKKKVKIK